MIDLQNLKTQDSVKYNTIIYYYTNSFIIEKISCADCIDVDITLFDVSVYENLRLQNERYTRIVEKFGVKVTLLSVDELVYKMPIHN